MLGTKIMGSGQKWCAEKEEGPDAIKNLSHSECVGGRAHCGKCEMELHAAYRMFHSPIHRFDGHYITPWSMAHRSLLYIIYSPTHLPTIPRLPRISAVVEETCDCGKCGRRQGLLPLVELLTFRFPARQIYLVYRCPVDQTGLVRDFHRLNVALSRAKCVCYVIFFARKYEECIKDKPTVKHWLQQIVDIFRSQRSVFLQKRHPRQISTKPSRTRGKMEPEISFTTEPWWSKSAFWENGNGRVLYIFPWLAFREPVLFQRTMSCLGWPEWTFLQCMKELSKDFEDHIEGWNSWLLSISQAQMPWIEIKRQLFRRIWNRADKRKNLISDLTLASQNYEKPTWSRSRSNTWYGSQRFSDSELLSSKDSISATRANGVESSQDSHT